MSSKLDQRQIFQDVHDESNNCLQVAIVSGVVSPNNPVLDDVHDDPNNCLRTSNTVLTDVHDVVGHTLKVSMPALTTQIELDADDGDSVEVRSKAVDVTTIFNAVDASVSLDSSGVNILKYKGFYVTISWDSLDAVDATIKLQSSLDDTLYEDISGVTHTLSTPSGAKSFNIQDAFYKYFKVVYVAGSNLAGTVTVKYVAKG